MFGDRLRVVRGCLWPVILRKIGVHYALVEAASVHGYMHSEAIKEASKSTLEKETFRFFNGDCWWLPTRCFHVI